MPAYEWRVTWAYRGQPLWHSAPTVDEAHARALFGRMLSYGVTLTTLRLERRRVVEWEPVD